MAQYNRVVIAGVGLLGGSIGLALRRRRLAEQIVGWGRKESLQRPATMACVDETNADLPTACQGADFIVICTPVTMIAELVQQCAAAAPASAKITDVGSTKLRIAEQLQSVTNFCGSHPLAGGEKSGADFADSDLFLNRSCVVTPGESTSEELALSVEQFWAQLGAKTLRLPAAEHDAALARTSHLPHIVASCLAGTTPESLLPLAATGWSDTTRVAAGGVELWLQIILENRLPILDALRGFGQSVQHWIEAVEQDDSAKLEELLSTGKRIRDSLGN
ncbi:MAG: prephenate dehydrogenase/arogenate dehydrogenase family protein [Planctomycetota bacterium]|nr:prephenate dehydrogenase/arogenate dehydrogenase family protein [Planctomycetota bacterium]